MKPATYSEPLDVNARLEELSLSIEVLHEAIKAGEMYRSDCTENDPLSLPGFIAWGKTVRSLREILVLSGWTRLNDHGMPLVVSPEGDFALGVTTGNIDTGNPEAVPKTRNSKGPATEAAVRLNGQMCFGFYKETIREVSPIQSDRLTWLLLVSRRSEEIRCELSLPSEIGEDQRVENWNERIILPPVLIGTGLNPINLEEEDAEDIVVEVSPRSKKT